MIPRIVFKQKFVLTLGHYHIQKTRFVCPASVQDLRSRCRSPLEQIEKETSCRNPMYLLEGRGPGGGAGLGL